MEVQVEPKNASARARGPRFEQPRSRNSMAMLHFMEGQQRLRHG